MRSVPARRGRDAVTVRSLQITALDGPDGMKLRSVPEAPADGKVVIDVHAAGVTFPDLLMTRGLYQVRPDLPFAPGLEVAGVVRTAPEGAHVAAGERVIAYTGHGGYSDVVSVPVPYVVPLHSSMDFVAGVALMTNYQTAYLAVCDRGRLQPGETLLVHGAAGGVGTAAIQIGIALGARVLAVVSDERKAEVARSAGAGEVLSLDGWAEEVKARTAGGAVDVIFDPVGGDRFDRSLSLLGPAGRALVVGFAEGRIPQIAANRLLLRNIDAIGVAWGPFVEKKPQTLRRIAEALSGLIDRGSVSPIIGKTYPLEEGGTALRDMEARSTVGKSVLLLR